MNISSLSAADWVAIILGTFAVIRASYEVIIKVREINSQDVERGAGASNTFMETAIKAANLYKGAIADIECLKAEVQAVREEGRREVNLLKATIAEKDKEYLTLKQEIAAKNEMIEKQQEALSKADRLHTKWEMGIEKLLRQMEENHIKPIWSPFDKD